MTPEPRVLEVRGISVSFPTPAGSLCVVDDVSFSVAPGRILGVVGESGSGKTALGLALMRLHPPDVEVAGQVVLQGTELLGLDTAAMRGVRGGRIAMIFQDPLSALHPYFT